MGSVSKTSRPDQDKDDREERWRRNVVLDAMLATIPDSLANEPGALTQYLLSTRGFSAPEIAESLDAVIERRRKP